MEPTAIDTTAVADSSPAQISGQSVLDNLSDSDRVSWERTGEIPDPTQASADSPPAPSGTQIDATASPTQPASEPGKPTKQKGFDARKSELTAEIQALVKQRDALKAPAVPQTLPAAPSPASTDKPALRSFTDQIGTTYESYEDAVQAFVDARDVYTEQQVTQREQARQHQQEVGSVLSTFAERISEAKAVDAEFLTTIAPEIVNLRPIMFEAPGTAREAKHDLAEALLTSEHAPALMRHLTEHQDLYQSLLKSPSPPALYRQIGRLEALVSSSAQPPVEQPQVAAPITKAPPPPPTLGKKPAAAGEAWRDAVANGDFSAYERLENAKQYAGRS